MELDTRASHHDYPGERFFSGLTFATQICGLAGPVGIPLFFVAAPIELAADILMLPYDLTLVAIYNSNKPLNEFILQNNLKGLNSRLEKGADPNFIDTRYHSRHKRDLRLPLMEAFKWRNKEAFIALLDHGAEVPLEFYVRARPEGHDFIKLALARGTPQEISQSIGAQYIVSDFIHNVLQFRNMRDDGFEDFYSIVKMYLENGFPPNPRQPYTRSFEVLYPSSYTWMPNALESIMDSQELTQQEKDRLVGLLRSYGAQTYDKLDAVQLPPETNIHDIPEMFRQAAEIFLNSNNKHCYRFSDAYPGIDAPVLVVDHGLRLGNLLSQSLIYRERTFVHHRETPTRWSQNGEPFDIPVAFRIVLTPKGIRIPSRIHGDMPTKDIILEEWLTLPTCEAYIEKAVVQKFYTDDLTNLHDLLENYHQSSDESYKEHNPLAYFCHGPYSSNYVKYDLMVQNKANAMTKAAGMKERWYGKVFSSHRNLKYLSSAEDHIAPRPDEFLIFTDCMRSEWIKTNERMHDYREEHKGQYYWNYRRYTFKGKKWGAVIDVFYGDEANPEEFEKIVEIAKKIYVK